MAAPVQRDADGFSLRVEEIEEIEDVSQTLEYLSDVTGADVKWLGMNQMRLWCNDLIFRTAGDPSATSLSAHKNAGKEAIAQDLTEVFSILDDYPFRNPDGSTVGQLRNGQYMVQFQGGGFKRVDRVTDLEEFHRMARGPDGEVRRSSFTGPKGWVKQSDFNRYKRAKLKHVGKLKAGWLFGADHFTDQTGMTNLGGTGWIRTAQRLPGVNGVGISSSMDEFGTGSLSAENQVEYAPFRIGNSLMEGTARRRQVDMNTDVQVRIEQLTDQFNDGQDVLSQINRSQFA
jgi:hypothetical protein